MVDMYRHTTFNLNPAAGSIDTPLHGFLPGRHVDHMHPNPSSPSPPAPTRKRSPHEIFGDEVGWVPWQRPGFDLGLVMEAKRQHKPAAQGPGHGPARPDQLGRRRQGLLRAHPRPSSKRPPAYIESFDKGEKTFGGQKYASLDEPARQASAGAAAAPPARHGVAKAKRFIGTVHVTDAVLQFVNSHDAARLAEIGTSCPDHFLRTKIKPLYVDWNPQTEDLRRPAGQARKRPGQPTARTTPPTTRPASTPTRPPCATPTRP